MKYCKKCGTLLEDSIEICIGCGTDVTDPENVSKYPPRVERKLEAEKKENKVRTTTVVAIIVVFVLLIGLVCLIIFMAPKNQQQSPPPEPAAEPVETAAEPAEEETAEEAPAEEEAAAEEPAADPNRTVKDDEGSYYALASLTDEGGNLIFTGLYPEDFTVTTLSVDYAFCSNRLPGYVSFIVDDNNEENSVRFIYFSPQHFWHKNSENKKSLDNGDDTLFQMSFLTYDQGQGYVDSLIKASYKDATKVTLIDTWDAEEGIMEQLKPIAKAFKKQIDIKKDYAHIGDGTEYAPMNAESVAKYYRYEILTKDRHTLFVEFYVPIIANNIVYSREETGDRGTVVEWIVLGVYGMVAGNEDLYDDYQPAFQIFKDNCNVNHTFYRILEQRCEKINANIAEEVKTDPVDADMLKSFAPGTSKDLNEFDNMLMIFTTQRGGDHVFRLDDVVVNTSPDMNVAFLNRDKERVFVSPAEDEYPGGGYEDMTLSEAEAIPDVPDDEAENKDKDKDKDKDKKDKEKTEEKGEGDKNTGETDPDADASSL